MPPVGSDLLKRSLNEVAATTLGGAFLTGFLTGFFLIGATVLGFAITLGLATTFGFAITFGLGTTFGLGAALGALGPLPLRASKISWPSWV